MSNDPASPARVYVEGAAPAPRLTVSIADTGDFGDTRTRTSTSLKLTLSNAN